MQALFKARFEQALESQKLNIKKIETQLRRKGINPEDPVAMASIQRVASTFFRAIDEQQGTPYVFRGDAQPSAGTTEIKEPPDQPSEDSDQEELDRFISEIESAAEKQWEEEKAAEKEESSRMRYWEREEVGERRGFGRSYENSDYEDRGQGRYRRENNNRRTSDARKWDDDSEAEASGEEWDSGDDTDNFLGFNNDSDAPDDRPLRFKSTKNEKSRSSGRRSSIPGGFRGSNQSRGNSVAASDSNDGGLDSEEEDLWGLDNKGGERETNLRSPKVNFSNVHSSSEEESNDNLEHGDTIGKMKKNTDESWDSD